MPSKRDPGKQGRQARNRARRQAVAQRRALAAEVAAAEAAGDRTTRSRNASTGGARATGGGRGAAASNRPVGWRAALAALLMSLVALVLISTNEVTVDDDGKAIPTMELAPLYQLGQHTAGAGIKGALDGAEPTPETAAAIERLIAGPGDETGNAFAAYWPISIIFPMPVLICAIAFWLVHTGQANGRQLMFCLFGMFFASMMTGMFYLPALVALGLTSFQIRRIEAAELMAARRAAAAASGDGDGRARRSRRSRDEVIDVEEVDELDDDAFDDELAGTGAPGSGEPEDPDVPDGLDGAEGLDEDGGRVRRRG